MLLLPNHRSYMDFLLLSTSFFEAGVPIPAIASGEDFLNVGPLTFMLRACGAFFMRRSFKEDPLYVECKQAVQSNPNVGHVPGSVGLSACRWLVCMYDAPHPMAVRRTCGCIARAGEHTTLNWPPLKDH